MKKIILLVFCILGFSFSSAQAQCISEGLSKKLEALGLRERATHFGFVNSLDTCTKEELLDMKGSLEADIMVLLTELSVLQSKIGEEPNDQDFFAVTAISSKIAFSRSQLARVEN